MFYFPVNFLQSFTYSLGYILVSLPVCNDFKIRERMSIRILFWGSFLKTSAHVTFIETQRKMADTTRRTAQIRARISGIILQTFPATAVETTV